MPMTMLFPVGLLTAVNTAYVIGFSSPGHARRCMPSSHVTAYTDGRCMIQREPLQQKSSSRHEKLMRQRARDVSALRARKMSAAHSQHGQPAQRLPLAFLRAGAQKRADFSCWCRTARHRPLEMRKYHYLRRARRRQDAVVTVTTRA